MLAQFTVELSQDGNLYLENKSVNPEVFRKTMDEWNQDYEGTLSLTHLLRDIRREFEELKSKIRMINITNNYLTAQELSYFIKI